MDSYFIVIFIFSKHSNYHILLLIYWEKGSFYVSKSPNFNASASASEVLGSKLYISKLDPSMLPSSLTSHRFQYAIKYLIWFDVM